MSDFEPINIEIAINSPETIKQASQVEGALKGLDGSVSSTQRGFKNFLAEKLRANGVTLKSLQLTKQEIVSLKKYNDTINNLKIALDKATDPTKISSYNQQLTRLQQKMDRLLTKGSNQAIGTANKSIKTQGATVQKTAKQWDGLGNSINQISRELPAFAVSSQIGFLAISNNIPILADQIARLKAENVALAKSGQKGVPIWRRVTKSLLSWQTAMSLGVTLLTIFGRDLVNWIGQVFKSSGAVDVLTKRINALNKAFERTKYKKAVKEVLEMKIAFNLAKKGVITKAEALEQYNETLGKALGIAKDYNTSEKNFVNKTNAYVKAMLYRGAANQIVVDSAAEIVKHQKEVLEYDNDISEQREKVKNANPNKNFYSLDFAHAPSNKDKANSGLDDLLKERQDLIIKFEKEQKDPLKLTEYFISVAKKLEEANKINPVGGANNKKTVNGRERLLEQLHQIDKEYARKSLTKDEEELQALKDKFDKIRRLVKKFNADTKNKGNLISLSGLNSLEKQATKSVTYRQDTRKLTDDLDEQKTIFSAYEAFKTDVSSEEADKRYSKLLGGYKTYGERVKSEQEKLQKELDAKLPSNITGAEKERLEKLKDLYAEFQTNGNADEEQRFVDAYNSVITHKEILTQIEVDFNSKKLELQKITNKKLRADKLEELEKQKKIAIDGANAETYEKLTIFDKLSTDLTNITRRELKNKIASLEEYLKVSGGSLNEGQEKFVHAELEKAKSIVATTKLGVRQNALLKKKEAILKRIATINKNSKGDVSAETKELEKVNGGLEDISAKKLEKISGIAGALGGAFAGLANDIREFDEGLADTIETMAELANIASDVVSAVASFKTGDIAGGIAGSVSAISGLIKIFNAAEESDRKAREEIKKWHDEIFESQLRYNAELRIRIADELKLNDIYQSRSEILREELGNIQESKKDLEKELEEVFNKLIKENTVVGKQSYKSGGFLGFFEETKIRDINETVESLLNKTREITSSVRYSHGKFLYYEGGKLKYTEEIFKALQKINANKPLTGDAKTAYEQLKKIHDEYDNIRKAEREKEKLLVESLTGTTTKTIADSIIQGLASGKKSFADFADDIEGFLQKAILSGLNSNLIERVQKLQEKFKEQLVDGELSDDEASEYRDAFKKIVEQSRLEFELAKTASGVNFDETATATANSLKGAVRGITAQQADLLSGQFGGLRLTQISTNEILKHSFSAQLERLSKSIEVQINIEKNTGKTANNTAKLISIDSTLKEIKDAGKSLNNSRRANGL